MDDPAARWVTFDVAGAVTVRLADPSLADIAVLVRQLGPESPETDRDSDLVVRFVDRLRPSGPLTWVGYEQCAYDDEHFYVHSGKGDRSGRARMPLDQLGGAAELVVERGAGSVPLLVALVNLLALSRGVLPLHASAVEHAGRTVLATGWSKGGKTELVVALEREGATYVSDEWSYLSLVDGRIWVRSLPEPVRIWEWQLAQLPVLRRRVTTLRSWTRIRTLARPARLLEGPAQRTPLAGETMHRISRVLARQAYVQVPPDRLFDGRVSSGSPVDLLLLVQSSPEDEVRSDQVPAGEVAERMLHSLSHERLSLTSVYQQYLFAFPQRRCALLDAAPAVEAALLPEVLRNLPAYRLVHPYPADLSDIATCVSRIMADMPDAAHS